MRRPAVYIVFQYAISCLALPLRLLLLAPIAAKVLRGDRSLASVFAELKTIRYWELKIHQIIAKRVYSCFSLCSPSSLSTSPFFFRVCLISFTVTPVTTTLTMLYAGLLLRFYAIWHVVPLFSFLSFLAFYWGHGFFLFVLGEIYVGMSLEQAWLLVCRLFARRFNDRSPFKVPQAGLPILGFALSCKTFALLFSPSAFVFWFRNLHACFPVSGPIAERNETCALSPQVRNWLKRSLCWGE